MLPADLEGGFEEWQPARMDRLPAHVVGGVGDVGGAGSVAGDREWTVLLAVEEDRLVDPAQIVGAYPARSPLRVT